MELNREQIAKELAMFIEDMPADLHLGFTRTVKFREFLKAALALIHELTEENERLEDNLIKQSTENIMLLIERQEIQADTVREMRERLKSEMANVARVEFLGIVYYCISDSFVDRIAEEVLEGGK